MRLADCTDHEKSILTAVMYNLIFCDEVGLQAVFDAVTALEGSRFWKHGVKRWAGVVRQRMRAYNMELAKHTGGYMDYIADLNDAYCEQLNDDIWRLKNVAVMALEKQKVADAEMKAVMYVAVTMAMGAVHNIEHGFDGFPDMKPRFGRCFAWMLPIMKGVTDAFKQVAVAFDKMAGDDYSGILDADQNVGNGFKVIANILHDGDGIIETCNRHAEGWEAENDL